MPISIKKVYGSWQARVRWTDTNGKLEVKKWFQDKGSRSSVG